MKTNLKNLGLRNRRLTGPSYSTLDRSFVSLSQNFRIQRLTGFSHRFYKAFVKKFVRVLGFHAYQGIYINFNNHLMDFRGLSYHSQHTTIRKLYLISSAKALPKSPDRAFVFRKPWKLSVTNWYIPSTFLQYRIFCESKFHVIHTRSLLTNNFGQRCSRKKFERKNGRKCLQYIVNKPYMLFHTCFFFTVWE